MLTISPYLFCPKIVSGTMGAEMGLLGSGRLRALQVIQAVGSGAETDACKRRGSLAWGLGMLKY